MASFIIFIVFLVAVFRHLYWAKKCGRYLYDKYKVLLIVTSGVVLIGVLASMVYSIIIYLRTTGIDATQESLGIRMLLYMATLFPPFVVSMMN